MIIEAKIDKTLRSGERRFHLSAELNSRGADLCLLGPSGSGKTLTLSCIAGLVKPDSGKICVNGRVLFDSEKGVSLAAKDRNLGYVFQDYALFPHLTVAENVGFGLKKGVFGRLSKAGREKIADFLEPFGIAQLADAFPKDISGGQKQRVALARALIVKPDAVLLDEPFSALDAPLRKRVRCEVRDILARFGVGGILISHDPEDVAAFGGTIAHCEAGRVCRLGRYSACHKSQAD